MSISDSQYIAWLSDPMAIKCTLIDVSVNSLGTEITRYISTVPYVMPDASIAYIPIINSALKTSEELTEDSANLSVSDIELANTNGKYDSWLNDIWANRRIIVRTGDVRWDKSDFRILYDGIVVGMSSRGRNTLSLRMGDKLQRLNTPITETKLGGSTANSDTILPLTFGEVHSITPLLTDPANLVYMMGNGPIERIIEVRDNGVPVPTIDNLSAGTFELIAMPKGTITCSVQGLKSSGTYYNKIADLVQFIVTAYGKATTMLSLSDIDTANFAAFNTSNPQPVGTYISDRSNILNICKELASSVGAQLAMSKLGKLRLLKYISPTSTEFTSTFDIHESDIVLNSLQISNINEVSAAVKLGYCKNWTVEEELETGIPPEHKDLFKMEWLTTTTIDNPTATTYKLEVDPVQEDTMLLTTSDAIAECNRRLELRKVPRIFYSFTGLPKLLQLELGQGITIYNRRFGMTSGKPGLITRLEPDYRTGKVEVEIMT